MSDEILETPELAYVSVAEAALMLGVHKSALYQAIEGGRLHVTVVMGKKALLRTEVKNYTPRAYRERRAHP